MVSDSDKLRIAADWFDKEYKSGRWGDSDSDSGEVQADLRRIADKLEDEKEVSYEQLKEAFVDLLDGYHHWYDINELTGFSEERCKEISELFVKLSKEEE